MGKGPTQSISPIYILLFNRCAGLHSWNCSPICTSSMGHLTEREKLYFRLTQTKI